MIWLLTSILFNAGLFLVFKYISKKEIRVFPAIVINYFTCFIAGNLIPGRPHVFVKELWMSDWILPVCSMGIFFITGFYAMGSATRKAGAAAASVASKMSVVIPALVAVIIYKESLSWMQTGGIAVSLFSVFLMAEASKGKKIIHALGLLLAVFVTSGAVDSGLNILGHEYGSHVSSWTMSTFIFGTAGLLGLVVLVACGKLRTIGIRELGGGVILGLVNYASLVTLLSGIGYFKQKTAWFFAVNNIGVVLLSTLLTAIVFKETIHAKKWVGLSLAVLAILMLNFYAFFGSV